MTMMKAANDAERCSVCHALIHHPGCRGYETLRIDEDDKEILLQHCPRCGTLFVRIQTIAVHSS